MKKIKKYIIAGVSFSLVLASGVPILASNGKIDPYANKDRQTLTYYQQEIADELNRMRYDLGLETLSLNEQLNNAAQSHSNYQFELNQNTGHYQTQDTEFKTGYSYIDRMNYYDYQGVKGGESIAPIEISPNVALEKMIDAPYHRIGILNPNHQELGVGINHEVGKRSTLVLNFGAFDAYTDNQFVKYPYDNQNEVKLGWFANERPNPLELFGQNHVYVGYPITLSIGDKDTDRLIANHATLTDDEGQVIDTYLVDSSTETPFKRQVIIIPKKMLKPNTTYTVTLDGERKLFNGESETFYEVWTFNTIEELYVTEMAVNEAKNQFVMALNTGDVNNMTAQITKDGKLYHSYRITNGVSTSYSSNPIIEGIYEMSVEVPFLDPIKVEFEVYKENGDWNVYIIDSVDDHTPIEDEIDEDGNDYDSDEMNDDPALYPDEEENDEQDDENDTNTPIFEEDENDNFPPVNDENKGDNGLPKNEENKNNSSSNKNNKQNEKSVNNNSNNKNNNSNNNNKQNSQSKDKEKGIEFPYFMEKYKPLKMSGRVYKDSPIAINFSNKIDFSTINEKSVFVVNQDGTKRLTIFYASKNGGKTIVINPEEFYNQSETYYLFIDDAFVKDIRGRKLANPIIVEFTVE